MLDFDLASLYEVPTKVLNQAVKRNNRRFPEDFMFRLTAVEWKAIRSQTVTASDSSGILRSQIVTSKHTSDFLGLQSATSKNRVVKRMSNRSGADTNY